MEGFRMQHKAQAYAYKETKLKTASQGQMIVLLYDGAIRNMDKAIELLEANSKKFDEVNTAVMKARDIVTELICALDMENGGEFAQRIFNLYMWFNEQMAEANMKKNPEPLKNVRQMMDELRAAWVQIVPTTHVEGRSSTGVNLAG
jgi:flagellar protein FliS